MVTALARIPTRYAPMRGGFGARQISAAASSQPPVDARFFLQGSNSWVLAPQPRSVPIRGGDELLPSVSKGQGRWRRTSFRIARPLPFMPQAGSVAHSRRNLRPQRKARPAERRKTKTRTTTASGFASVEGNPSRRPLFSASPPCVPPEPLDRLVAHRRPIRFGYVVDPDCPCVTASSAALAAASTCTDPGAMGASKPVPGP